MNLKTKLSYRRNFGFTMLELLIVMAILGLLVSFLGGNYIAVKRKGRDAQRKHDLKQVQNALEMYYNDKGLYPSSLNFGNVWTDSVSGTLYMGQVPQDPRSEIGYTYFYEISDAAGTGYRLYARLENSDDIDYHEYTGTSCNGSNACTYRVVSPNLSLSS